MPTLFVYFMVFDEFFAVVRVVVVALTVPMSQQCEK